MNEPAEPAPRDKPPWRHVRAALVLFHVSAVLVLSLPGESMMNPARWRSENFQSDVSGWNRTLAKLGVHMSDAAFASRLRSTGESYMRARSIVAAPFLPYPDIAGTDQGWTMFSSPQRHPVELHIDVERPSRGYQPLFRPRSDEFGWRRDLFDHHRLRKLFGRFAREFSKVTFERLSKYVAALAFKDFPDATRVRIRLYSYDTLEPARVRAGEKPVGTYTKTREFTRP
ncbi:MAG: hypothetical protein U0271_04360 [Polyangiaceae bacterium]